jgi:2-polyprenyl-3-methyl-5-hydroxy-6-metoxy-1,4-benzoquinol methylase
LDDIGAQVRHSQDRVDAHLETDNKPSIRASDCSICGPGVSVDVMYPATFALADLSPETFSARRLPDRVHYRIVRCRGCGLVRSDPVVDSTSLHRLYGESTFDYASEVGGLRSTYGRYLEKLMALGGRQESLLEVGCGNGFFLEEALDRGYRVIKGVEPSTSAIDAASERVRPHLVQDVMRPDLFAEGEFDAICMFQVLDHLPDPGTVLDACWRALRPGGLLLALNHNVEAVSAHVLGERSPIIDIEHTYLYSPVTVTRILRAHGFQIVKRGRVLNSISLRYLSHLFPLPPRPKALLARALDATRIGGVGVRVPLGNLFVIAKRPL